MLHDTDLEEKLMLWINELDPNLQLIVKHRYGLCGCDRLTLEQLSQKINMTRERIRLLQLDAVAKLKKFMLRDC